MHSYPAQRHGSSLEKTVKIGRHGTALRHGVGSTAPAARIWPLNGPAGFPSTNGRQTTYGTNTTRS